MILLGVVVAAGMETAPPLSPGLSRSASPVKAQLWKGGGTFGQEKSLILRRKNLILAEAVHLPIEVVNNPGLARVLHAQLVLPLSLASGDFDEDGRSDLALSYLAPQGGIITFHRGRASLIRMPDLSLIESRGNRISRHARSPESVRPQEAVPFDSRAHVYPVSIIPEVLAAVDGDADGHLDLVAAERGNRAILLLKGDGRGGFSDVRQLMLPGELTELAVGDVNRRDGISDLVVGVTRPDGHQLLIFEGPDGFLAACPKSFAMPEEISAITIGQVDDRYPIDIVLTVGAEAVIILGREDTSFAGSCEPALEAEPRIARRSFPARLIAVAVGDFLADGEFRHEIALLDETGVLHIVRDSERVSVPLPLDEAATVAGSRHVNGEKVRMVPIRMTGQHLDDLIVARSGSDRLFLFTSKGTRAGTSGFWSLQADVDSLDVAGGVSDLLAEQLNADGQSDLVILPWNSVSPWLMMSAVARTFVVTHTGDGGPGSLRQAILDANSSPGPDVIVFDIPTTGVPLITPQSPLPEITEAVTIDGSTQPAGYVEIDGSAAGVANGLTITGGNSFIRGLVITRFRADYARALSVTDLSRIGGNGIVLSRAGGNRVEGCVIGTNLAGEAGRGNGLAGILVASPDNIIGGSSESARNVLSGNVAGLAVAGSSATGNLVQGNFVGVDRAGRRAIGNSVGILVLGAPNNTIGGVQAGARNILSGNAKTPPPLLPPTLSGGIAIADFSAFRLSFTGASGNLVQGNFIGTDGRGEVSLANGAAGVAILSASGNTIGGTVPAARNIISGNSKYGIVLAGGARNFVQGNFIGLAADGQTPLPNHSSGVLLAERTSANLIGGTAPGAVNIIAFNEGDGISVDATAGTNNAVWQNRFVGNAGIEVNLMDRGETISMRTRNDDRDPDTGPNNLQNYPELMRAEVTPDGWITLVYRVDSSPVSSAYPLTIEVYAAGSDGKDRTFLARDTYLSESAGRARTFVVGNAATLGLSPGDLLVATATDASGNTSEFSSTIALVQQQDFTLTCTPSVLGVAPGSSGSSTCTVTSSGGFASPVTLSCRNTPAGVTCSFNQNPITPTPTTPASSVVTINVGATTTVGTSAIQIVGTSGSLSRSADLQLTVGSADLLVTKTGTPDPVVVGNELSYAITVRNNGPQDATGVVATDTLPDAVTFGSVRTTQGTCTAEPPRIVCSVGTLANGSAATITLTVRPSREETLTNTVSVRANEADPASANNSATATTRVLAPRIEVNPATVDFGPVVVGQKTQKSITVRNTGTGPLGVTGVAVSDPQFSLSSPTAPFTVDPGKEQAMLIEFQPTTPGVKTATLTVTGTDPTRPTASVTLRGEGIAAVARIEVSVQALDFGAVLPGHSSERMLTLKNTGTAPLIISAAATNNPQFTVVSPTIPLTIPPGGQQTLTLRFTLMGKGLQTGTLTITSNDPEKPMITISLSGSEACRTLTTGDFREAAGRTITIPINLSDASDIAALRLVLTFDPAILAIRDRQAVSRGTLIPADFSFNVNVGTRGQLALLVAPPLRTPIPTLPSQAGTVALVTFDVVPSAPDRTAIPLRFSLASAASPAGVPLEICVQDGKFTVRNVQPGDVTQDGLINEQDLLRLIAHLTGESPLTGLALEAADTNCDGMVNEVDLIFLIQHLTGEKLLPDSCPVRTETPMSVIAAKPRRIALGQVVSAGEEYRVPVVLDNPEGIAALRLSIYFDPTLVDRITVERGDLAPEGFVLVTHSQTAGEMVVLLMPPLASPLKTFSLGSGSVLRLRVRVKDPQRAGEALSSVTIVPLGASDATGAEIRLAHPLR
ncbi:MAG TPA: choice-of-anchor D domain-containing protein [Blastocatellia bacterium]|nr:choice-of-anchor D domain-containing protein [Blastocatellia bacterium]